MRTGSSQYLKVVEDLRAAYNSSASKRDEMPKSQWKVSERAGFLERLHREGKTRLLEIGAGTGNDALFFQEEGLHVVASDLSPEMVQRCRAKGLEAHTMDFLDLDFPPASFDAVYALNCLLHVPNADLPAVLSLVRALLVPGGLFFIGAYGGESSEGIAPDDWHNPPRFFSLRSDEQIQAFVAEHFEVIDFHIVEPEGAGAVAAAVGASEAGAPGRIRFQSLTLRRPTEPAT